MKQLMMKARAGVTLVELLVVILIVTILSVSMLPLLQPFVTEAQYAAEAIPVIGNIRTKVGVYQYDKGVLPCITTNVNGKVTSPKVETWVATKTTGSGTTTSTSIGNAATDDHFGIAYASFPQSVTSGSTTTPAGHAFSDLKLCTTAAEKSEHFGSLCDIGWEELKGRRSKPVHYQYLVMQNGTDYAYFVGCFGDGNGLKKGTGYAVCEIVSHVTGHKYVGTWKRYRPVDDTQVVFTSSDATPEGEAAKNTYGCFVPDASNFPFANETAIQTQIGSMKQCGWEF